MKTLESCIYVSKHYMLTVRKQVMTICILKPFYFVLSDMPRLCLVNDGCVVIILAKNKLLRSHQNWEVAGHTLKNNLSVYVHIVTST